MSASQNHGFKFEEYVLDNLMKDIRDKFKDSISYTNEWDFPPISIKSFKNENEEAVIEFGSIDRIFTNENSYFLVLIGYTQVNDYKIPNFSDILFISQKNMKSLKGDLDEKTLQLLNEKVKSFGPGKHKEARTWAAAAKKEHNEKTTYDVRFKIDSKKQRRIQCALKLKDLYNETNNDLSLINKYNIPKVQSSTRIRNKK